MSSRTWFTSDLHFGHRNIIQFCNRPFSSVEDMDRGLIERWNETVDQKDTVWVLGDFAFRNEEAAQKYLARLNGTIHLVYGNHDSKQLRRFSGWASSQPYAEINLDGHFIVLSHYAHRVWNKSHRGSLMLYGHSHGSMPGNSQSLDVGVDAGWDYRPISLQQILARMATLPAYASEDGHGESK